MSFFRKPQYPVLRYYWDRIDGPNVILDDATAVNPTFIAPTTTTEINITFSIDCHQYEGTNSKPDYVTLTVDPISTILLPPIEESQTIHDIING